MQANFHLTTSGPVSIPSAHARYAYQCFPVRNAKYANDGKYDFYEHVRKKLYNSCLKRIKIY